MKRFKILFGQRRFQVLAALGAVVLAASVAIGSGASFTAQSANATNVFSAGKLAMSNTPSGMSVTISDMVPGDYHDGTVTIKNTGTVQGHFYLEPVVVTGDSKYSEDIQLTITDAGQPVYSGSLSGLAQEDLGTWKADETHTYSFNVTFPDKGTTAGVDGAGVVGNDNQYQGASTTAAFNWTTVSVSTASR